MIRDKQQFNALKETGGRRKHFGYLVQFRSERQELNYLRGYGYAAR